MTAMRRLFTALAFLPALAGGCSDGEALVPVGTCTGTSALPAGSPILYGLAAITQAMAGAQDVAGTHLAGDGRLCRAHPGGGRSLGRRPWPSRTPSSPTGTRR